MAIETGALQQEAGIPKLTGIQFDGNGDLVNLFRGTVSFPLKLLSLPGRNGLNFDLSIFYQSDQAVSQVGEWNLDGASDIVGTGWSMPYEHIIVDPNSTGALEDNQYYWVMSGQPTQLYPLQFGWVKGVLSSSYSTYLVAGTINPALKVGLLDQQIFVSDVSTLININSSTWELRDPTNERIYSLVTQENGSIQVQTGGYSFELYNYQYWQISYYPLYERWEIIKNDGGIYSFGGSGHEIDEGIPPNVQQYGVKWGNWIGPSIETTGQERYTKAWNLSKIENSLGNYYYINYLVEDQNVGPNTGALSYTKSCLISKVKNDLGWSVVYNYADKIYDNSALDAPKEYLDPHKDPTLSAASLNTPDAYQSTYLTKYLDELVVYNGIGDIETYTTFEYYDLWNPNPPLPTSPTPTNQEKLAYGATFGRYLKCVTQHPGETYNYPTNMLDRYSAPGILFNYCFSKDSTKARGLLTEIISANGGSTSFTYQKLTETSGNPRSLTVAVPTGTPSIFGSSAAVRTWAGPDYTVCCWYDDVSRTLQLYVYTWVGQWVKAFSGVPANPDYWVFNQPIDLDRLQVIPSQNTFLLVLSPAAGLNSTVYFFNRVKLENAVWQIRSDNSFNPISVTYKGNEIEVFNGNDFFLVQNNNGQVIDRYTWDPVALPNASTNAIWYNSSFAIPQRKKCYVTAGTNYYVIATYDYLAETISFTYYGQDLYDNWSITSSLSSIPISPPPLTPPFSKPISLSIPGFNGFEYFQMSASPSFVAMSIVTGYTLNANNGFDSFDYEVRILEWDQSYALSIKDMTDIVNSSSGTFQNLPSSLLNSSPGIGPVPINNFAIGTGPNYINYNGVEWVCQTSGLNYEGFQDLGHQYYWYTYDDQGIAKTENTDAGIISLVGNINPSNPASGWNQVALLDDPRHIVNRYTQAYPTNAGQYLTIGNKIYAKPLSSDWGDLNTQQILTIDSPILSTGESIDTTTMINNGYYLAFQILDSKQNPKAVGVIYLKNGIILKNTSGTVLLDRFENQQLFNLLGSDHLYKSNVNGKMSPMPNGMVTYPSSIDSLDDTTSITLNRYSGQSFKQPNISWVATTVSYNSGYDTISNYYKYEDGDAASDSFRGTTLKFYKVIKYLGCTDPAISKPNGYTISYFCNGMLYSDLPAGLRTAYSMLDGQLHRQETYDASNVLMASTAMDWSVAKTITTDANEVNVRVLRGGIPRLTSSTSMQDGVSTSNSFTYSSSSGQMRASVSGYYDSQNRQVQTTSETIYAYEKYNGMWYKNMLMSQAQTKTTISSGTSSQVASSKIQTYKLWTIAGNPIKHWGAWKGYVPTEESFVPFTWWNSGEPTSSDGWIKTNEVLERGAQGNVISTQDLEGIKTTTIYDDTDTLALAIFNNATFEDGITYASFEDYQTNPWTLSGSGGIINTDSFTGAKCYQLDVDGSTSSLSQTLSIENLDQFYSLNLWFKTAATAIPVDVIELEITATGSTTTIATTVTLTEGEWKSKQWVVNLNDLGVTGPVDVTINIKITSVGPGWLRIDDIIFSPVISPFSATAYDVSKLRALGTIGANGVSAKPLYNMWGPYSSVGTYNQTSSLGSKSSVRQNPDYDPLDPSDPFPQNTPNFALEVAGRAQGFYDLFKSNESLENYDIPSGTWTVDNNILSSTHGPTGNLVPIIEIQPKKWFSDLAAYVNVVPFETGNNPTKTMYIEVLGGNKDFYIVWNGFSDPSAPFQPYSSQIGWLLLKFDLVTGWQLLASNTTTDWQPEWLVTVFEDRILFSANGILIFNYQDADIQGTQHNIKLGSALVPYTTGSQTIGFTNLTIVEDIQLGISYKDGIGRTLQSMAIESSTSSIMVPSVYDSMGRAAISILPSRLVQGVNGVTNPFAYQPNFVTNGIDGVAGSLWENKPIAGDIATYNYHSDAEGFPFSRAVYEKSPIGRVKKTSAPGKTYAIRDLDPLNPTDKLRITTYAYGKNTVDPGFVYSLTTGRYYTTTVIDPDENQTIHYKTTAGQTVGTIAKGPGGINPITASGIHDLNGRLIATVSSNYYQNVSTPQINSMPTSYVSRYYYDFWGRKIQDYYPDSGNTYYIYDNVDRIRFTQDAEGAAAPTPYYHYMKYDVLERAIEKGTCTGTWNVNDLQDKANTDKTWPTALTSLSNTTKYDGDETTEFMIGRTWEMNAYNGSVGDTADIKTTFTYRSTGQVTTRTQEAIYNGTPTRSDTMYYTYDINGRLLSTADSVTDLVSSYNINRLGQLIETVADTGAKAVHANYVYDQEGRLEATKLYKPNNTLLTDRAFTYQPKGSLLTNNDAYVEQALQYETGACSPTTGYYNGALAHNKVTYNGVSTPPPSDYCYTIDHLNRVTGATNSDPGGTSYAWAFDANSNFTSYTEGTETRTYHKVSADKNQIDTITSTGSFARTFTYNAVGDIEAISDGSNPLLNFAYNPWNGKARSIEHPQTDRESVFDYGPMNGRVRKRIYDTTTTNTLIHTVYNTGALEIEDDGTTTQTKRYVGIKGSQLIYHHEDDTFYWVMPDHLGSTRAIVDENGDEQSIYNYNMYGVPTKTQIASSPNLIYNRLFTGQYYDEELELYNYKARFYDPVIMQFLQTDPVHQFFNPYSYVGGMPNMLTDPSGMSAGGTAAGVIAGTAAALVLATIFTLGVGAIFTVPAGAATLAVGIAAGVVGGAAGALAGDLATAGADHQKVSWKQVGIDVAAGAVSGLIGGAASGLGGYLASKVTSYAAKAAITGAVDAAGSGVASITGAGVTAGANHQRLSGKDIGMSFAIGFGSSVGASLGGAALSCVRGRMAANTDTPANKSQTYGGSGAAGGAGGAAGAGAADIPFQHYVLRYRDKLYNVIQFATDKAADNARFEHLQSVSLQQGLLDEAASGHKPVMTDADRSWIERILGVGPGADPCDVILAHGVEHDMSSIDKPTNSNFVQVHGGAQFNARQMLTSITNGGIRLNRDIKLIVCKAAVVSYDGMSSGRNFLNAVQTTGLHRVFASIESVRIESFTELFGVMSV